MESRLSFMPNRVLFGLEFWGGLRSGGLRAGGLWLGVQHGGSDLRDDAKYHGNNYGPQPERGHAGLLRFLGSGKSRPQRGEPTAQEQRLDRGGEFWANQTHIPTGSKGGQ